MFVSSQLSTGSIAAGTSRSRSLGTLALLFLIGLVSASSVGAQQPFVRGDVNNDGARTIYDPFTGIFLYLADQPTGNNPAPFVPDAADTNDNGVIEIADSVLLFEFLFTPGAPEPAAPSVPGLDTTPVTFTNTPGSAISYSLATLGTCPGGAATFSLRMTNTVSIEALSFHLAFDPSLTVSDMDETPMLDLLGIENEAMLFFSTPGEIHATWLFDIPAPTATVLSPGLDREIFRFTLTTEAATVAGTTFPIAFVSDLNHAPPLTNVASTQAGQVVEVATTSDGALIVDCTAIEFRRGDANEDGAVSIADAIRILGYLFSGDPAPTCLKTADSNASGAIDIADGIHVLFALFASGAVIPAPGPSDCGPDPFGATLDCPSYPGGC